MKWRRGAKQALVTMAMVYRPSDVGRVTSACGSEWSDIRIISELRQYQEKFGCAGVMPANVYYLAIQANDPSACGWEPTPGEEEPPDVSVRRFLQQEDKVFINKHISPPVGVDVSVNAREVRGLFMSDSGALAYNGTVKKSKWTTLHTMLCKGDRPARQSLV
eukprot:10119485-Heterocapsa_arctica.AAC.1